MYSFYLNQKEEISVLNDMLANGEGCTIAERAKQYHIPLSIAKQCCKKKIPQELIEFVQTTYQKRQNDLQNALTFHTNFWNKNGDKLKKMLSDIMEQDIPSFRVRLQSLCGGISDWKGTNVAINAFEYLNGNPVWYSTLIWETILALTFVQIRKKYTKNVYPDETVWAVAEMTACSLINTDFEVNWKIGYKQLSPHQDKVIQMYLKRKDFSSFLEDMLVYFDDKNIQL